MFVACANHEGRYEPSCTAYEGDTIELRAGRFEWQRFTDQRQVDDEGNVVNPFPGFPKTGKFRFDTSRLILVSDTDVRLDDWLIINNDGQKLLLTVDQHAAYTETRIVPACALKLSNSDR